MIDKIINMINSVGVFDTAKYFGGLKSLKKLTKDSQELTKIIDNKTKGKWVLSFSDTENNLDTFYHFKLDILDFDVDDDIFLNMGVNLTVNFNNLNKKEIQDLKVYLLASALDIEGDIELKSSDLDNYTHKMIFIYFINGEVVPDELEEMANTGSVITHTEAFRIMEKIKPNSVRENFRHKVKEVLRSI